MPVSLLHLLVVVACGPDLARLEVQQQALDREVEVLRSDVETMRSQLQAMGMLPRGPEVSGVETPAIRLNEQVAFTSRRIGSLPELPALGGPQRRAATACGWRFFAPWLDAVSDITLERTGSGQSSPIILYQNDTALLPHALVPKFEKECAGAFRVQPRYVFFSPLQQDDVRGSWSTRVSEELPLRRGGDGLGVYWVYPGTEVEFRFARGWDPAWGPFRITLDARLLGVGVPDQPRRKPQAPAEVEVLGERRSALDNRMGMVVEPAPPTDSWTLRMRSPERGPWVLIETLTVGNDDRAVIVAGEGAP